MADALFEMDDAPRDGSEVLGFIGDGRQRVVKYGKLYFGDFDWCYAHGGVCDEFGTNNRPIGYLPLPKDASSPAVAETAGKWLSRCSAEDVAAVIRHGLAREDVRDILVQHAQSNGRSWEYQDADYVLGLLAQEATDD